MRYCPVAEQLRNDNYWSSLEADSDHEDQAYEFANVLIEEVQNPHSTSINKALQSVLKLPGRLTSWQQRRTHCRNHTIKFSTKVELMVFTENDDGTCNVKTSLITRVMNDGTRDSLVHGGERQPPSKAVRRGSAGVMPGMRGDNTVRGVSRRVNWAMSRLLSRLQASLLRLDLEAIRLTDRKRSENAAQRETDCPLDHLDGSRIGTSPWGCEEEGNYSELRAYGITSRMDYSKILTPPLLSYGYVVDQDEDTLYGIELDDIIELWQKDNDVSPEVKSERGIICRSHLSQLRDEFLWEMPWCDAWDDASLMESMRNATVIEEVADDAHPLDNVTDCANVTMETFYESASTRLPRPRQVLCNPRSMPKLLQPVDNEMVCPTLLCDPLGEHRVWIIDTGASKDILAGGLTETDASYALRKLRKALGFRTVSKTEWSQDGVRMSVADWDVATSDVAVLDKKSKNQSNLLTVGGRTMHAGMTFIWVRERFPVFIPDGMRYIIILDLDGIIPVYRKNMEKEEEVWARLHLPSTPSARVRVL